tara:strand:- start:124 stop:585 length:462 start_codon:yes stop_codon:yes gene_type:complete
MGNSYSREGHMLDARMVELVKNHMGISISQDISDFDNVDCMIYNESTADGYDVWVVTNDSRHVSICENVYYYDNDIANAFEDQVRWGDQTFYIDDGVYEDSYIEDKLIEMFAEKVEDIIEDDELDITLEEINYLKEEYGIEEETEEADTTKVV